MPSGPDPVPPPGAHPPPDRRISFLQHAACCRGGGLHATYRPAKPGRPYFTGEAALQHPPAHRVIISAPGNSSGFGKEPSFTPFCGMVSGGCRCRLCGNSSFTSPVFQALFAPSFLCRPVLKHVHADTALFRQGTQADRTGDILFP